MGSSFRWPPSFIASNFGGKPHEFTHKCEVLQGHCRDVGRDYDEITRTWSPEVFIRESEAEIVEGGTRSFVGEPYESWHAGNLVGTIEQTPPAYSAIHIDGKRAYQRIRAGEVFEMPTRLVNIVSLRVLRYDFPKIELETVCGSGTYIRSLGIDLARAVGTVAVMTQLRRLAVGPFLADDAVSLDRLRNDDLGAMLLPATLAVQDLPRLIVDSEASRRLGHGLGVDGVIERGNATSGSEPVDRTEAAAIAEDGRLRAIVRRKESMWYPYRVFPAE